MFSVLTQAFSGLHEETELNYIWTKIAIFSVNTVKIKLETFLFYKHLYLKFMLRDITDKRVVNAKNLWEISSYKV